MSSRPRRNHTSPFKAKVAIAAIKSDTRWRSWPSSFDVHPNQSGPPPRETTRWTGRMLAKAVGISLRRCNASLEAQARTAPYQDI